MSSASTIGRERTPNEMTAPSCRSREGSRSVATRSKRRKMSIAVKRIETRREYAMLSSPPMLSSSIHRWTTLRDASA